MTDDHSFFFNKVTAASLSCRTVTFFGSGYTKKLARFLFFPFSIFSKLELFQKGKKNEARKKGHNIPLSPVNNRLCINIYIYNKKKKSLLE